MSISAQTSPVQLQHAIDHADTWRCVGSGAERVFAPVFKEQDGTGNMAFTLAELHARHHDLDKLFLGLTYTMPQCDGYSIRASLMLWENKHTLWRDELSLATRCKRPLLAEDIIQIEPMPKGHAAAGKMLLRIVNMHDTVFMEGPAAGLSYIAGCSVAHITASAYALEQQYPGWRARYDTALSLNLPMVELVHYCTELEAAPGALDLPSELDTGYPGTPQINTI